MIDIVIPIWKPVDWTSFDVVKKIRNIIKYNKVGHAGSLDPFAEGVLMLCTGKFTKKVESYMDKDKEYLLVWTTTPWTLTSNIAAAVNVDLDYVKLRANDGGINTSGETYLYAAWAECPLVNSKGVPVSSSYHSYAPISGASP